MRTLRASLVVPFVLAAAPALADGPSRALRVTSTAFAAGGAIPSDFACDGEHKSPPLSWSGVPPETKSIAILVDDPDAARGAFTHWMITNIPPSETSLSENGELPAGAKSHGYTAVCPPDSSHRYHFHVYALDTLVELPAARAGLLAAIDGHVLAQGELVASYGKRR